MLLSSNVSFDQVAFIGAIEAKRRQEGLSRRELARRLDISSSTFTRLGQGRRPDIDTFMKVLAWLDSPAENFFDSDSLRRPSENGPDTVRDIAVSLHRDQSLSREQASTIEDIVRVAYHRLREG